MSSARPLSRRRSRRVVLGAALALGVAQIACSWALDAFGLSVRFPEFARRIVEVEAFAARPDIAFFGSSRSKVIDADRIPRPCRTGDDAPVPTAWNAAVDGGDPTVALRWWQNLVRLDRTPRLLLVEVTPDLIARRSPLIGLDWVRLLEWPDAPGTLLDVLAAGELGAFLESRFTPLHLHRREIGRWARATVSGETPSVPAGHRSHLATDAPLRPLPADPPPMTDADRKRIRTDDREMGRWLRDYEIAGPSARSLESLLEDCRARGVRVVLYRPPVSSTFREVYAPRVERIYSEWIEALVRSTSCRYVDASAWLPDAYFGDSHHILHRYGVHFTDRLVGEVIRDEWARLPLPPAKPSRD